MQPESHFERTEKTIPLKPETQKAIEELYKPPQKKPHGKIEKILAKSPEFGALSEKEIQKEKEFIEREMR